MEFDLVLLHPPSFYDFRKNNQFRGPISDVVPSSSVFDMYPIGFTSIAGYLERFGHRVKIVNLAARMVHNRRFDVEKKIRGLKSAAFGISLHWLPHAQGSIEIARLVKKYHPDVPVIFGGLSSTYYHRELMQHDCVDFVMRGDSTESAMLSLIDEIKSGTVDFSTVPNLTWKRDGKVFVNPIGPPPANLDDIDIPDYRYAMRSVFQYHSLLDALPYEGWLELSAQRFAHHARLHAGLRSLRRVAQRLLFQLRAHQAVHALAGQAHAGYRMHPALLSHPDLCDWRYSPGRNKVCR